MGFWLSRVGKPYNGVLFNIHKLLALGSVIAAGIQMAGILTSVDEQSLLILLLIVAALCVIALFASGALMSMDKLEYRLALNIHRIAPVLLVLAVVYVVYLLS
jgi:hypothetical protein